MVESGDALLQLQSVLLRLGYEKVREPGKAYRELDAQTILENDDGCRFDVFNRQVVGKLIFSVGMVERSEPLETRGNLSVKLTSAEDVFLFKSVTPRADDRGGDMNVLVQSGLDFDVIHDELRTQAELLDEELFVTHVNEALIDLEERFGVTTPLTEPIERLSIEVYDQLAILNSFDDVTTVAEIQGAVEFPDERIDDTLESLEEKGNVTREGDTIRKLDDRP